MISYRVSRYLLMIFLRLFFRVKVYGTENLPEAPYILTPNHVSLLDPALVGVSCRKDLVVFMAKKELFTSRFFGWWARFVGCIPVDRGKSNISSLKKALQKVNDGYVVCIFPEGTRSVDGDLQEAKRGVGFLISKASVPVVPVYVDGSQLALPKGGKLKFGARINVLIGKPLMPDKIPYIRVNGKTDYEAVTNVIMERITALRGGRDSCE